MLTSSRSPSATTSSSFTGSVAGSSPTFFTVTEKLVWTSPCPPPVNLALTLSTLYVAGTDVRLGVNVGVETFVGADGGAGVGSGVTLGWVVIVGLGTVLGDGVELGPSEHPASSVATSIALTASTPIGMDCVICATAGALFCPCLRLSNAKRASPSMGCLL